MDASAALLDEDAYGGNNNGAITPIQGLYTPPETEKGPAGAKSGLWTGIVRRNM